MKLKSLTYSSFAALDLTDADISAIHRTAREINALNGITGLLIFNGTHFLQLIEGPEPAIDELLDRLRRDERHHQLEVLEQHILADRQFPDWSMELIRVSSRYLEAREAIAATLPDDIPEGVGNHILRMTEQISGTVRLPD